MTQRREECVPTTHNASTYRNYGCRCPVCVEAKAADKARYMSRKKPKAESPNQPSARPPAIGTGHLRGWR